MRSQAEKQVKEVRSAKLILIVEDEANAEMLKFAISQETPYKTCIVSNSAEALQVMETIKPNLILMDYSLPGIDGLEIYERMRANLPGERVPVIIVTASTYKEKIVQSGLPLLEKPYDLEVLFEMLHRHLDPK